MPNYAEKNVITVQNKWKKGKENGIKCKGNSN